MIIMSWKVEQDEKNMREQFQYPDMAFPFSVWPDIYSLFLDRAVDAHWHYDFEYSYVVSGSLDYYINDTYLRLQPGDCVFVNSNMLHTIRQPDDCDNAIVYTAAFPTSLVSMDANSTVYAKFLKPIIASQLEGFKIGPDHPLGRQLGALLTDLLKIYYPGPFLTTKTVSDDYKKYHIDLLNDHLNDLEAGSDVQESRDVIARIKKNAKEGPDYGYELECMSRVVRILSLTICLIEEYKDDLLWRAGSLAQIERAREILAYMHEYYRQAITIEDISKHVGISRKECFRCFKRFTGKKPIEYLNNYRMLKAAQMLRENEMSIEVISEGCGFSSASFFGKMFKEKYDKTPLQFRRLINDEPER